ncbi:hypothetical protein vBPaeMUSP25_27 [Pseudomonas phage vB_PaeM_USP_25]|nr:hypothetical protein vBPaeMUSP25_27 [Pseudomonas phage vB_PaeM_USP_25]
MHQPRPYGLHGDLGGEEDAAVVEALVRRLTNIKDASGVGSLKMVRALPSGAVAIAMDMGGVLRVVVQGEDEAPTTDFTGVANDSIPMLFSGVVRKAVLAPNEGLDIQLTRQAQLRIGGYGDKKKAPVAERQRLMRFAIDYGSMHSEFRPRNSGAFLHTQYAKLRPTWFSGSMATVVQVAGGYGRQDLEELPESPVERATMVLPDEVRRKVALELGNLRLPGYTGMPPKSGQIQFDYKFHQTHAVSFDSTGRPWLVRVSSRGVYAMPMPMVPATTARAFREYIEEVGDDEILWLLDRFGGMPSGEGFPVGVDAFEAWRRAGVISKVCDTGDFYQHIGYATACGWSFNTLGTQGFNTCYNYDTDGVQLGFAYMLSLQLGPAQDGGRLPEEFDLEDPQKARLLDRYLSALYRALDTSSKSAAIKYKLRRVPVAELLSRAGTAVGSNAPLKGEVEHWDQVELEPIAAHGGSVARIATGNLWAPGQAKFHPQIKFAEPFMEGCVSHDFSPAERGVVPSGYIVRCNTIMFGYYVGNDLKVVKYFYDQRQYMQEAEDNYDDCMTVGSWERTETQGVISLLGHFYTSDIDERDAKAPITTVTKTVGTDLGYDTKPHFSFDYHFSMVGTMWRNRYYQHVANSTRTEGYGLTLAVCAPFLERNALLHAKRENTSGGTTRESLSVYSIRDPNSYRYMTYDFVWAWMGGDSSGNAGTALKVSPYPVHGNPVWVTGYNYNPHPCSDFADQGDWVGGLPQDYTWLIHPVRSEWHHSGGGGRPTVKEYSRTERDPSKTEGELVVSLTDVIQPVNKDPSQGYFLASPNDFGDVFYVDATKLCAGESVYANVSEADPEAPKQRKRWGYTRLADHKSAHHFIGVINE